MGLKICFFNENFKKLKVCLIYSNLISLFVSLPNLSRNSFESFSSAWETGNPVENKIEIRYQSENTE